MKMDLKDKVTGMFEGLALGDALGAPYEFHYNNLPYSEEIIYSTRYVSKYQGVRYTALGQVTDDTEMTLTLAHTIVDNGGYDVEWVVTAYQEWANSTFMLGRNTRALFKGVSTYRGYLNRYDKIFSNPVESWTQSNGSLMRCSPLALFDINTAITDCKLTNPHPVNIEASTLYLTVLRRLLERFSPKDAVSGLTAMTEPIKTALSELEVGHIRDVSSNKGWVVHSFYLSLYALLQEKDYRTTINYVIQRGGDTDTNAAISGALLGAYYGHNVLVSDEITRKNLDKIKACNSNQGCLPRSERYTLKGLSTLTDGLIRLANI